MSVYTAIEPYPLYSIVEGMTFVAGDLPAGVISQLVSANILAETAAADSPTMEGDNDTTIDGTVGEEFVINGEFDTDAEDYVIAMNLGAEAEILEVTPGQMRVAITQAPSSEGTLTGTVTNDRGTSPAAPVAKVGKCRSRWPCNAGSGTNLADSSGVGNNTLAKATGTGYWISDSPGSGGSAGSGGCIQTLAETLRYSIASPAQLPSGNTARTICFWYKLGTTGSVAVKAHAAIASRVAGSATAFTDGATTVLSPTAPAIGVWKHFAFAYSGTSRNWRIFENGTLIKSGKLGSVLTTATGTAHIELGGNDARIKDARVYAAYLTASEIRALAVPGASSAPMFHWPCNEGAGTSLGDVSGNAATLAQAVGTTAWDADTPGAIAGSGGCLKITGDDTAFQSAGVQTMPLGLAPKSLSCWFKFTHADNAFSLGFGSDATAFQRFGDAGNRILVHDVDGVLATDAPSLNAWHHYCAVHNGSTTVYYEDGVIEATTGTYAPASQTQTEIFFNLFRNGGGASVKIKDLRLYDRALTAAEAAALAGV